LIAAGIAAAQTACPADSRREAMPMKDVVMSVRFVIEVDAIRAIAEVVNSRSTPIFVIDSAFTVKREGVSIRRDNLIVSFDGPDTAILSSKLLPLDKDKRWATPPTAYATRIDPGARYAGEFRVALPLRAGNPGAPTVGAGHATNELHEQQCKVLRFELGAIPWAEGLVIGSLEIEGRRFDQLTALAGSIQEVLTTGHPVPGVPCILAR
jgi:hypothetical protein